MSLLSPKTEEDNNVGDPVIEKTRVTQEKNTQVRQSVRERAEAFQTYPSPSQQNQVEDYVDIFENEFSLFTDITEQPTSAGINVIRVVPDQPIERLSDTPVKVAIIIDDMGISRKWSRKMAELAGPLTLSYLPYAEDLQAQADYARQNQHHLMLHMPMQALGGKMENTPGLLRTNTTQTEFMDEFYANLSSFDGFAGVNNHMGSRLTRDRTKMNLVMQALKSENLYFIDSKTIHDSIAAEAAESGDVPYLVRDVFLDHEETIEYAREALQNLERQAVESGVAIAIGHPKEATYIALKEWLPTLAQKNIQLVHAGTLIKDKYPQVDITAYIRPE